MILDEIFQDYHEDEYDLVQSAFDKISGNRDCESVHREVYRAYQQNPSARVIELSLPRRSGKSTWISQVANTPECRSLVVTATQASRRYLGRLIKNPQVEIMTPMMINGGSLRGRRLDLDIILFDDIYIDEGMLDKRDTILQSIYVRTDLKKVPPLVSLYTRYTVSL